VPAIISWPGHIPENEVRTQIAHGCDWFPTLAELCGIDTTQYDLDGSSITALIADPNARTPHKQLI
jgi:arylsulfatase A-like enzyme